MERDIRYITVGLVVGLLLAFGVGLVLWQASDQSTGRGGQEYAIPFDGSVGGLAVGSSVRYMGMHAGNVTEVDLASDRVDQVEVRIRLNEETPINASTVARIRPQGITGRSYVGLTTTEPTTEAGPAPRHESHDIPVLRGKPSQLDRLLSRLPGLLDRFEAVAANTEALLNADNRRAVSSILDNTDQTLAGINQLLNADNRQAVSTTLDNTSELTGEAISLAGDTRAVVDQLEGNLASLDAAIGEAAKTARAARGGLPAFERATANVADLSKQVDEWMTQHGEDFGELGTRNLRELRTMLRDARRTSRSVRELSEQLSDNPSQLIYKPRDEGMEIPR